MDEQGKETTVVRIRMERGVVVQDCEVYIGRACNMGGWRLRQSKWANPFTLKYDIWRSYDTIIITNILESMGRVRYLYLKITLGESRNCWHVCRSL